MKYLLTYLIEVHEPLYAVSRLRCLNPGLYADKSNPTTCGVLANLDFDLGPDNAPRDVGFEILDVGCVVDRQS